MINPDHISTIDSDGITSPNVPGVDFRNENIPENVSLEEEARKIASHTE